MSVSTSHGSTRSVGTSALRVEDIRLLTGRGRYVDDKKVDGLLHAAFVRSPLPHGRIVAIDVTAALALDGVIAVYTGRDIAARTSPLGPPLLPELKSEPIYALAVDKVLFVGDPVAIVVAENRYLAEDGCELVDVEYEQLAAIATFDQALDPNGAVLFETLESNVVLETAESFGDVDGAFAEAELVIRERFEQHRVAQVPLEGRGGTAVYDSSVNELTFYGGVQSPHSVRGDIAKTLAMPLEHVRVVNGDIGGAFGLKIPTHREDMAVCAAAAWLDRPVKWIEDRSEHLLASGQARQSRIDLEAAVNRDGTILGLRGELVLDQGAYPSVPFAGAGGVYQITRLLPGPYSLRGYAMAAKVVTTNKCTYNAYRGPWAMETWARERMINVIAAELGLDPADVRRRNFAENDGSASMITGLSLIGTSSAQSLERALELADYPQVRQAQRAARSSGRCVGVGFATFIEAAPGPAGPSPRRVDKSRARIESDGTLSIFTTQAPHGQGHETTLAQIASDEFEMAADQVRIRHGDTSSTPYSIVGTGGSRAGTMASGAVLKSTRGVKAKLLAIAADLFEADVSDLIVVQGRIHPRGVPSVSLSVAQIAAHAYAVESDDTDAPVLECEADYDGGIGGWSGGTHLCQVEIDLETGLVTITRYLVVEDCGRMINPAIVEGQIRGGVAQGIGEVLYECSAYDEQGNYLAATFKDYLLPTASDIPEIEIDHLENEPNEEVNYRGVGEGGMLVAPAALTNAIEDALSPFGARVNYQYLPPTRVLELARVIAPEAS